MGQCPPMDALLFLMDFILHVDRHLAAFVAAYGPWVYALLFAIVFVETGLVVMPFLPGDSLLFVTGALAGAGLIDIKSCCPCCWWPPSQETRPTTPSVPAWAKGLDLGTQPVVQPPCL